MDKESVIKEYMGSLGKVGGKAKNPNKGFGSMSPEKRQETWQKRRLAGETYGTRYRDLTTAQKRKIIAMIKRGQSEKE